MERDLAEQPIAKIMQENSLKPSDLVEASMESITHKMVSRACKGRRLTPHVQAKIMRALNAATGKAFVLLSIVFGNSIYCFQLKIENLG
jgi:hypothetical protein